ncbi:DUF2281 domain-containing protein [Pseudanabaena sp. PCC 6802]|uniref:DUF2281 domain-containing protein n=1 Tax=Pseudanabaena sp. PCC 6802 TaxID=118173 RepID=UPI000373EDD7|nr:DUF2281 domain-containing protein [Pseudanabaena sp. PCC 6802]
MSNLPEAVNVEQLIMKQVRTLSVETQQEVLDFVEFLQAKRQQNQVTTQMESSLSMSQALIEKYAGCLDGGPSDLSSNKKYLEELGKK